MKAEASWDSTVHKCPQLSRGGVWPEQRVYLTVRVVVQLSHPADMQLVLRKRICVNVNPGRQGFAQNLLKRMSTRSTIPGCGVTFEVVSNIPGVRRSESLQCLAEENLIRDGSDVAMFGLIRMRLAQRTGRCWPDSLPTANHLTTRPPSRNTSVVSSVWRTSSLWIDSDR